MPRDDANESAVLRVDHWELPQLHVAEQVADFANFVCSVANLRFLLNVIRQIYMLVIVLYRDLLDIL